MSESTSPRSKRGARGLLRREIWPRTVRAAIVSAILPWWRARSRRVEAEIATFSLPGPLATLIRNTARATRLWPEERMDVARELGSHFADGMASGRTPDQLAADFGNAADAARLIRDAKVRCRPMWWKSFRWVIRGAAALTMVALVTYGYLAARYFWGSPVLRHNYMAEMNVPILAMPKGERAWPVYIQAMRELGQFPAWYVTDGKWPRSPAEPHWNEGVEFLKSHAHAIALIRQAAAMPTLGYVYASRADPEYMHALEVRSPMYTYDESSDPAVDNPAFAAVVLAYLGEMRIQARFLKYDADVAVELHDRERFMADVEATLNIGEQALSGGFLVDTIVGISLASEAADLALEQLHAGPSRGLLDPEDELRLAHRFASFGGGRIRINADREGRMWEDFFQRLYSDNGAGDGHLVQSSFDDLHAHSGVINPTRGKFARATMPLLAAALPSRAQMGAQAARAVAAFRHDEELPFWRADERTSDAETDKLLEMCRGPLELVRSLFQSSSGESSIAVRDRFEAIRWGVMTVCALHAFKRAHGHYPAELAELVPALLPALPIDPCTGKTMRYKLVGDGADAAPLLYSVGVDQTDDGGTFSPNPDDRWRETQPKKLAWFRNPKDLTPEQIREMERSRGDWIIFPPRADGVEGRNNSRQRAPRPK